MHRQRRKQTAEVFELELSLLHSECPNLGAYTGQPVQLFPDSLLNSFLEGLKGEGVRRVKNLGSGPNACLRGFGFFCLKSIYEYNNQALLNRFKQELYPEERNLTAVISLPDNLMELSNVQMKKLMVEFIHVVSYCSDRNRVEVCLSKSPIVQLVMLLLLRAILRDCKIEFADQFDHAVDWVEASLALSDIFDVDVRFTHKVRVCEFTGRQFYIVCQNESYYMVYFEEARSVKLIDINDLEFQSVSVSSTSQKQGLGQVTTMVTQSDNSTPKFKLYIDSQKKHHRRSHKNSFGGELDVKAAKGLSNSSIFNRDSAFGEVIRKHRLSEESVEITKHQKQAEGKQKKEDQKKKSKPKEKAAKQEEEAKKTATRKKRSVEKVQRTSNGPRFLENPEPLNMEMVEIGLEPPSLQVTQPQDTTVTPLRAAEQPRSNVFRWDERSTFSQLAGLKINEEIRGLLADPQRRLETPAAAETKAASQQKLIELPHKQLHANFADPGSPSHTLDSMQPGAHRTASYAQTLSTENRHDLDNQMTCSKIIELLEPSVRESMKQRKLSVNTELLKSPALQAFRNTQAKNSLILEKQLQQNVRNAFEQVMNESMIGVVNMPHSGSKPRTTTTLENYIDKIQSSEVEVKLDKPQTALNSHRADRSEGEACTVPVDIRSLASKESMPRRTTESQHPVETASNHPQRVIYKSKPYQPVNIQIKYVDKAQVQPVNKIQSYAAVTSNDANWSPRRGSALISPAKPTITALNQASNLLISSQNHFHADGVSSTSLNGISHATGSLSGALSGVESPIGGKEQRNFTKAIKYSANPSPVIQFAYQPCHQHSVSSGLLQHASSTDTYKPSSAQYPADPGHLHPATRVENCFKKNYERPVLTTTSTQSLLKAARQSNPSALQFTTKKFSGDQDRRQLIARR